MSEPLRSDPARTSGSSGDADRAARIEQLLLSGLDHYFAGHYEQAINVWTRVVFLERGNGRARAYIERARSALAEQQRESEELLHRGVAAYNAGDMNQARDLLTQAVEQGGAVDEALVFLQRLNRVTALGTLRDLPATIVAPAAAPLHPGEHLPREGRALTAVLIAAALVGGLALGAAPLASWLADLPGGAPQTARRAPAVEPLPVVRTPEVVLARSRELYAGGHLKDALRGLDRIDIGDPLRGEADRLRADIQRDILAVARMDRTGPSEATPRP